MTMQLPGTTPSIFGQCWSTPQGADLSMPATMASGNQAVSEATLRRWTTTAGQLIDDPNYGRNVYDLVNADLSPTDLASEGQQFAAEAEKDERVLSCSVTLTLAANGNLTLAATIVTAAGPFKLVLQVNAVTLALLLVSP
jgi:hypothetical protein